MTTTIDNDLLHHIRVVQQNPHSIEGHTSFGIIWKACLPIVTSTIAQVRLHGPDMDDVIQQTCINLWNDIPEKFDSKKSIRTYVRTIARNRAVDLIRGNTRRSKRDVAFKILLEINPLQCDSRPQNESRDEHCLLEYFIARYCDDVMKEIIHLAAAEFSFPEIAEKMKLNLSTVKTKWRRFCIKFKEYYAHRVTP